MDERDLAAWYQAMSDAELAQARREAATGLSLLRPASPMYGTAQTVLSAIDAELAERSASVRMCSCGFATDDRIWLEGHLFQHPGHHERTDPKLPRCP